MWNLKMERIMKKLIATFAAVGLLGLGACAAEEDTEILDDPVLEETTPPIVTEPVTPPLGADTMMMDPAAPTLDDTAAVTPPAEPM
jgi:hypothetical protein